MTSFLLITIFLLSISTHLDALPQATVDILHENFQSNIRPIETINLEGLDYLLRYASNMFDKHLKPQPQVSSVAEIEIPNINEKLLPPLDDSHSYYMPLYMSYDDKIDSKSKHLLKINPPEKTDEPNYYSAKPKKIPKKYSAVVKHVNIKREAIPSRMPKEKVSSTTEFSIPKMSYDWIPIIGHNHRNSKGNYDVIYGTYDDDSHPAVPETEDNQEESLKLNTKKVKSRERRDVYDILSNNERLQYQMHGFGGPKTYKFGYDTGKGKDRHFRFEERKNDGSVKGEYGFVDDNGKMSVVRYSSNSETGFQVQH